MIERELAVPVVRGVKSPSERFAGADETYTVEALMQNGCAADARAPHVSPRRPHFLPRLPVRPLSCLHSCARALSHS